MPDENISLCACGCGEPAPIIKKTERARGYIAGQPREFIHGHNRRKSGVAYLVDEGTGCWVWQRTINIFGYGVTSTSERHSIAAHRAYYEAEHGPVPDGMELDHLCRNRACVNPSHLEAVTKFVNVRRGDRCKLDVEKVREIKRLIRAGESQARIAGRFGVVRATISDISRGRTWGDVQ